MGHGNHWEAIAGDIDMLITRVIPETIAHGTQLAQRSFMWHFDRNKPTRLESAQALVHPTDTPLRYLVLLSSNSASATQPCQYAHSAYPYLVDGVDNTLTIERVTPWGESVDQAIEGIIEATTECGVSIGFFDPLFYLNKTRYKQGARLRVTLAGLAYCIRKATDEKTIITEGPLIEMARKDALKKDPKTDISKINRVPVSWRNSAVYTVSDKFPDDAAFRCPILAVKPFKIGKRSFLEMEILLVRPDDHEIRIKLFASRHVLHNYHPHVGDDIEGYLWLQGVIKDKC